MGGVANDGQRPIRSRYEWMDNLRLILIVGVIGAHIASAYVIDSDWYYMERTTNAVTELAFGSSSSWAGCSAWAFSSSWPGS
jgi:hypothetical protein